ncbi:regulatory protein [Bryocella elongata]|uniref:Regulatory protein RecX n=1 Tax=Bryocella elongata TaxID=863522 RepID=A0A1H5SW51_9BACT|nr:regulatory protein RecX [Bryocella elongata]SEF54158.1 regulatory protein [Bryocella elongata]
MSFGRSSKPKPALPYEELLDLAVKSLASKMKSERDLRRKIAERAEDGEAVDRVMAKLKELGYLSDERFAAEYTRSRQENEKFGRRRVQQGLMQKGIATPVASAALATAYDDVDEAALARAYVERKRMKAPSGDREQKQKETAKIMRRLMAAGFSTRAVWKVLREWGGSDVEEVEIVEDEIGGSGEAI